MSNILVPTKWLEELEDYASNMQLELHGKNMRVKNKEALRFAEKVYMTTHWILAPHCRGNHKRFNPDYKLDEVKGESNE